MLYELLAANRSRVIERTRAAVMMRSDARPTDDALRASIPLFLERLLVVLRKAQETPGLDLGTPAVRYGGRLIGLGFTVSQVVRDYGTPCQVVIELAAECDAPISADELLTINLCLDDAIAEIVTEHSRLQERRRGTRKRSDPRPMNLSSRSRATAGFRSELLSITV